MFFVFCFFFFQAEDGIRDLGRSRGLGDFYKRQEVKTTDLPWAHVMHPVTDPSMQGLGHTPTSLAQGSWAVAYTQLTPPTIYSV